jgi:hypothetical protein
LYEAMKQEAETGVAIVEEELVELKNNLADWLE